MKVCPNPECLSYQQNRTFPDTDVICPRCGEPLVDAPNQAYAGVAPAVVLSPAARSTLNSELALLGAAGTMILAGLIIAVLIRLEVIHKAGRTATPTAVIAALPTLTPEIASFPPILSAAQVTATAAALATTAAQNTPLGAQVAATAQAAATANALNPPTPTLPPGFGTNGATIAGGVPAGLAGATPIGNNVIAATLCTRIATGQPCTQVTTYSATDIFYLAVEANFAPSAVRALRVRLYGPPNGETLLLPQEQTSVPGRDGRYWVGFAFSQNRPWQSGIYRADIFVNTDTQRSAFVNWTVP